jgi:hypothetical protein
MKTWYRAVCDEHGEAVHIFVNNPTCTAAYLSDSDQEIGEWLSNHHGCELRLIWHDLHLDKLWDEGYDDVHTDEGRKLGLLKRK